MSVNIDNYKAIDPMALILSGQAYLNWVEMHHPHVPSLEELSGLVKTMKEDEKKIALAQAKSFKAYGEAVIGAIEGKRLRAASP